MVVGRDGAARALTPELWSIEGLAWTPDGRTLVFSGNASGGGQMQPMAVPADGSAPASRRAERAGRGSSCTTWRPMAAGSPSAKT